MQKAIKRLAGKNTFPGRRAYFNYLKEKLREGKITEDQVHRARRDLAEWAETAKRPLKPEILRMAIDQISHTKKKFAELSKIQKQDVIKWMKNNGYDTGLLEKQM